ncbi:hypothetical protein CN483_16140 [Bacillus cereus]|uniref:hypothetical protein n=1 Tax=Bacillus cereus TaxID=1396 RepID=UPI000BF5837B|nr:hypothetical protein [Bacillus cereus]PEQ99441.1 hypothetical protein CN483_16140 [Bacillus cereus]
MEKFEPEKNYIEAECLFQKGLSITKSAQQKGLDRKKLSRYLKSKGHKFGSRQPNEEKYAKAIEEYKAGGVSIEFLRKKYKLDRKKLSMMLKKCGVKIKSRPLTKRESENKIRKIEEAEKLFLTGYSLKKAAKKVNLNYYTLCEYFEEEGYDISYNPRTYVLDETVFEKVDSEEKAYWLVFLYADGNNNSSVGKLELTLKSGDRGHLIKFQQFLKSTIPIKPRVVKLNDKEYEAARIIVCSKKLTGDLYKLGCVDRKSLVLTFPSIDIIPAELTSHFIRGYYDGDGSIHVHDNELSATISFVGTEVFLKGIQQVMKLSQTKLYPKGEAYQCSYSGGNSIVEILNQFYNNAYIYLQRKYDKYLRIINVREERYKKRLSNIDRVIDLYKKGKNTKEIHEETGIFKNLIVCWLEYYADYVPKRNLSQQEREAKKSEAILNLLEQGYGFREIDRRLQTSTYRVKMVAMKNGFCNPDDLL